LPLSPGRADPHEAVLGQHLLAGDVVMRGRRLERMQPVSRCRRPPQFPYDRARHAAPVGLHPPDITVRPSKISDIARAALVLTHFEHGYIP
jgi:hypothetical protein